MNLTEPNHPSSDASFGGVETAVEPNLGFAALELMVVSHILSSLIAEAGTTRIDGRWIMG